MNLFLALVHPFRWTRLFFKAMLGDLHSVEDPYSYDEEMDPDWDGDWDNDYAHGEMEI